MKTFRTIVWTMYCMTFFFSTMGSGVILLTNVVKDQTQFLIVIGCMSLSLAGILWLGLLLPSIKFGKLEELEKQIAMYKQATLKKINAAKLFEEMLMRITNEEEEEALKRRSNEL